MQNTCFVTECNISEIYTGRFSSLLYTEWYGLNLDLCSCASSMWYEWTCGSIM